MVNFLGTLQNGPAQAFSSFDTYLAICQKR